MKSIIVLASLIISTQLFSKSHKLVNIVNKDINRVSHLNLLVNEYDEMQAIQQFFPNGDTFPNGKTRNRQFKISDINKGVVLLNKSDYDVIYLKGHTLSGSRRGKLTITYKTNVVFDNRDERVFIAQQASNGEWEVFHKGGKVKSLNFYAQTFGVKKLEIELEDGTLVNYDENQRDIRLEAEEETKEKKEKEEKKAAKKAKKAKKKANKKLAKAKEKAEEAARKANKKKN